MQECEFEMKVWADLKITDDQDSQSDPNVVVSKHGHLTLNIHPAKKKGLNKPQAPTPSPSYHRPTACSPAMHCVVVVVHVFGAIFQKDGPVAARLVSIAQQLDFPLIVHKRVCHHAVHEEHERLGRAVNEGAQAANHHQHFVLPGGEPILQ